MVLPLARLVMVFEIICLYISLVVILDKNGKVLGKMGFKNVSPEEYIKMIHAFEKK